MKINLSLPFSLKDKHMIKLLDVGKEYGIDGFEIRQNIETINSFPLMKRAERVITLLKEYAPTRISYNFSLRNSWKKIEDAKRWDLAWRSYDVLHYAKETISEAGIVARYLSIKEKVPINFHLLGYVAQNEATLGMKMHLLKTGEMSLRMLREYASLLSMKLNLRRNGAPILVITRENNPVDINSHLPHLLDFHPYEISRTMKESIFAGLNLGNLQQYISFYHSNGDDFKWIRNLERELYPPPTWENTIERLKEGIMLIHISDAKGYWYKGRKVDVGEGEVDYYKIFTLISEKMKRTRDIIYTLQIHNHNKHPNKVRKSIEFIIDVAKSLPKYKRQLKIKAM